MAIAAFKQNSPTARKGRPRSEKSRQARRGMQAMVAPLASPTTTHGEIFRAARRDGPVFARNVVTRRLIWITKLRVSRLAPRKNGFRRGRDEPTTAPQPDLDPPILVGVVAPAVACALSHGLEQYVVQKMCILPEHSLAHLTAGRPRHRDAGRPATATGNACAALCASRKQTRRFRQTAARRVLSTARRASRLARPAAAPAAARTAAATGR